jgi:EAL domain-containing protein (putative c-di-GMP-specific phosphodiesterase class I)
VTPPGGVAIRVVVADDDPGILDALCEALGEDPLLDVVGASSTVSGAVDLARLAQPDVVLADVRMPDGGGPRIAEELRRVAPATAVLALSADDDQTSVLRMLEAGAVGYLVKGTPADELVRGILRSVRGQPTFSDSAHALVVTTLAHRLRREHEAWERQAEIEERVRTVLDGEGLAIHMQSINDLLAGGVQGYEALSRFSLCPIQPPDRWFAEAEAVGLGADLELHAIARACALIGHLPPDSFLSVNIGPSTLMQGRFTEVIEGIDPGRLVVEITEHAPVADYEAFSAVTGRLRARGIRLAVDDTGAGYASLQHVARLEPDFIKLDRSLVDAVDTGRTARLIASAFAGLAAEMGAEVIAEGVERPGQLATLRDLGVRFAQGFLLGRPRPIGEPASP